MSRSESQTFGPHSIGGVLSHAIAEAREGVADATAAGFAETAGSSLCRRGAFRRLRVVDSQHGRAGDCHDAGAIPGAARRGGVRRSVGTKGLKLQRYAERAIQGTATAHAATATAFLLDWCGELLTSLTEAESATQQQGSQP